MGLSKNEEPRSIDTIAGEIIREWNKQPGGVWFGAKPYLDAMLRLRKISDSYGYDSAKSIIAYFLGNARQFKGERAKALKAELKAIAGIK